MVRKGAEGGTVAGAVIGDGSEPELRVSLRASDLLERTWSIYRSRLSTFVSLFWGVVVIQWLLLLMLVFLLAELIDAFRDPSFSDVCHFMLFVGQIVIPTWLTIGQIRFTLGLARGEQPAVEDIFGGGLYVLTVLLAAIPVGLLVGLPTYGGFRLGDILLLAPEGMTLKTVTLALLGLGGGLVLSLYFLARLGQFHYLIIDRSVGVGRALLESWQLTRGRATTLMAVYVLLVGINLVGLVALVVGVVFTMPSVGMNAVGLVAFMVGLLLTLPFTSLAAAVVYDALGPETLPQPPESLVEITDSDE